MIDEADDPVPQIVVQQVVGHMLGVMVHKAPQEVAWQVPEPQVWIGKKAIETVPDLIVVENTIEFPLWAGEKLMDVVPELSCMSTTGEQP